MQFEVGKKYKYTIEGIGGYNNIIIQILNIVGDSSYEIKILESNLDILNWKKGIVITKQLTRTSWVLILTKKDPTPEWY